MGIKSIIFTSLQKFDGNVFRWLLPHEYIQGAGRGGRRGKDKKGYVFHLNNIFDSRGNQPDASTYRKILNGKPPSIESRFDINFKLILSLISTGQTDMEKFVKKSMLTNEINKDINTIRYTILRALTSIKTKMQKYKIL